MAAEVADTAGALALPDDDEELLALAAIADLPPPGEGLFRDGSWLRKVNAEPVLLFGGGRALLLEVAHPLVAAGVAEHSDFRADPFGRLRRTLQAMTTIAFRDRASALAAARAVERAHRRVRGRLHEDAGRFRAGTPYDGRDPQSMRWVWATLVDTALAVYERFVSRLDPAAREAYYGEQCSLARVLGVPPELVPSSHADFQAYFDDMLAGDAIAVTDTARQIAAAVLETPRDVPGGRLMRLFTAALLPARLRAAFGLAYDDEMAGELAGLARSVRALRRPAPGGGRPSSLDASAHRR